MIGTKITVTILGIFNMLGIGYYMFVGGITVNPIMGLLSPSTMTNETMVILWLFWLVASLAFPVFMFLIIWAPEWTLDSKYRKLLDDLNKEKNWWVKHRNRVTFINCANEMGYENAQKELDIIKE